MPSFEAGTGGNVQAIGVVAMKPHDWMLAEVEMEAGLSRPQKWLKLLAK
jgi:hypothetical protein